MKTNRCPPIINQFLSYTAYDAVLYKQLGTQDNDDRCAVNGGESLVDLQLPLRFVAYVASTVTKFQHEGKIEHHCSSLKTNSDRMLVIKTSK